MAKSNIRTYQVGNTVVQMNRSRCSSCGTCAIIAPEIFELDNDLISQIKQSTDRKYEKILKKAETQCLYKAIKIIKKPI